MSEKVRIGCIGCGGNAKGHMRGLGNVEDAQLVAVCDLVKDLAEAAAGEFNARPYTNMNEMLDKEGLDAVYISIPVHTHGAPEMAAIERGLPFLVEKPVARTMETAREIEKAVADKDIQTAVGYQLRYTHGANLARELLDGKTIGMAVAKYWCGTGRGNKWTQQFEKSGGQILEQATHTIDMLRNLVGDVEEVYNVAANRVLGDIDCPDVNSLTMKFANGAVGSMSTCWHLDPKDWSNANVVDVLFDANTLHFAGGKISVTPEIEGVDLEPKPAQTIDAAFVRAVKTKDFSGIKSPYADAVKTMAVSIAAIQSAETGKAVRLSEV
ncbi:MAG: Gfo/Idh/MocA family oxidoreductase [Planctomycetes bacterium]|nr:Gfo/Idh/MocA family oxidoreductase [Planctomycetota bacterium]